MTITYKVKPGGQLKGNITVPGDKSISHRAIMLGGIAEGTTHISGFLEGQDTLATLAALRNLGVQIERPEKEKVIIHGVGLHGLKPPKTTIDCGNSGTSLRLLAGILSAQPFESTLTGDESLCKRPMQRVITPLTMMGATLSASEAGTPPLSIYPAKQNLQGIHYTLPVASAQVKSAILLAGLYAKGKTTITEKIASRDHTERMLSSFGYDIKKQGNNIEIQGGSVLKATDLMIPADISSATFFIVGAAISPGSDITLLRVGINPTRTGVLEILKSMGANIELQNQTFLGAEPIADIRVQYAPLHGIEIPTHLVPSAMDEFPAIFIAAANAQGETLLAQAEELRVKESDRIHAMAQGLKKLGINAEALPDGMRIIGGRYHGGKINSYHDHRIAMAFAMAALNASDKIEISPCDNVATSFPQFVELGRKGGLKI